MEIGKYKFNIFVCDGTSEQKEKLKEVLQSFKADLKDLALNSYLSKWYENFLEFCEKDFDKLELEKGKKYRLLSLANRNKKTGEPRLEVCDECGEVYCIYEDIKPASGFRRKDDKPALLSDPNGSFLCKRCASFDMVENTHGLYIPIDEREKAEVDVYCHGELDRGFFYKRKGHKIDPEKYFIKKESVCEKSYNCYVRLKNNYVVRSFLNREQKLSDGGLWVFKRVTNYATFTLKRYFFSKEGISSEKQKNIEENIETNGEDLYETCGAFAFKKENGFLVYESSRTYIFQTNEGRKRLSGKELLEIAKDGFYVCPRCSDYIPKKDAESVFLREETAGEIDRTAFIDYNALCRSCVDNLKKDPYKINSYSTKYQNIIPSSKHFCALGPVARSGNARLFYGVELEANTKGDRDETVRKVLKRLDGYVFAKHDGSLDDETGVEFVSAPATFEKTRAIWSKLFNTKYARRDSEDLSCKDLTAWSDPRCGLHIHVSADALRSTDTCHIVYFINVWTQFCAKIAGRNYFENRYSAVKNLPAGTIDQAKTVQDCFVSRNGHYDAVNIENYDTVEIRIFKANVTMSAFFRCLEFVDALVNFSKTLTNVSFEKMTPACFMKYCAGKNKYSFLNDFFKKHETFFKEQKIKTLKLK